MLFSHIDENGLKTLNCDKHGYRQVCNCSPSDFVMRIVEESEGEN